MNQTNKIKVAFSAQVQIKLDQREEEKKNHNYFESLMALNISATIRKKNRVNIFWRKGKFLLLTATRLGCSVVSRVLLYGYYALDVCQGIDKQL